ncbi:MAG: hypothetical protein A2806_00055 [Candidatus Terrybacteria bacterium RIFCSPHIGHO2_01_FULL_48_17]|uniref:Protein-L-isoaspartate O-methyltransferase n=1 Tax=Candidatus Terrybacteria bacterium RIFCSPHIGHO2_01_FULL_48_17 TaxID=1802362 RepID=A0A1G2PLI1_9BACT|nr:MAG: hypothetical protein A2806_00055 [Candidatus Terrybacteria bacterium RIFCSPHIGHO2_01_FULL_48_17]OHA53015.1 MAG: hypothetical protein A3A30_01685 [Candidatus Terrybacteria bacterium RIFCSPLOWO2_01_FULL_48_14]
MTVVDDLIQQGILRTPRIVEAFRAVSRENFVSEELRIEAELNAPLPIGHGQTISQPLTVAFMLELLEPQPGQKVLDIGAGSGWQTVLLAYIVSKQRTGDPAAERVRNGAGKGQGSGRVYAVERVPELCEFGKKNVAKYNFIEKGIVQWICGDASGGLPEHAPYDRIIAAAAGETLPYAWKEQCAAGGIIVAPIQSSVWRFRKKDNGSWDEEEYPGFAFVPLIHPRSE